MQTRLKLMPAVLLAFIAGGVLPGRAQEPRLPGEEPSSGWHKFGEPARNNPAPVPSILNLPAGTWITVRVDQGAALE